MPFATHSQSDFIMSTSSYISTSRGVAVMAVAALIAVLQNAAELLARLDERQPELRG